MYTSLKLLQKYFVHNFVSDKITPKDLVQTNEAFLLFEADQLNFHFYNRYGTEKSQ